MQYTRLMQSHKTMNNETMHKMTRIIKDMKVIEMNAASTTDVEDMEVEVDSLGIMTTDHVGPSSASHAIKKVINMQTAHTRT